MHGLRGIGRLLVAAALLSAAVGAAAQRTTAPRAAARAAAQPASAGIIAPDGLRTAPTLPPAPAATNGGSCVTTADELQAALDVDPGAGATEVIVYICIDTTIDVSASGPIMVTPSVGGGSRTVARKVIFCSGTAPSSAPSWDSTGGGGGSTSSPAVPPMPQDTTVGFFTQTCVLDGLNQVQIMRIVQQSAAFEVDLVGLRFQRGNSGGDGGAILLSTPDSEPRLLLSILYGSFLHNSAAQFGGALAVGPAADVVVTTVDFFVNSAVDGGGAIALRSTTASAATFTATDLSCQQDTAALGGAIYMEPATVFNSTLGDFRENAASSCGDTLFMVPGTAALPTRADVRFQGVPPVINDPFCDALNAQVGSPTGTPPVGGGACAALPFASNSGAVYGCTVLP